MNVLLSIKPQFADKIFSGEKKYEFRRVIFKNYVKKVVVYASAPVSKVIGEFEVADILTTGIDELWEETKKYAGITKGYFLSYFRGRDNGYAIEVKKPMRYSSPRCIRANYGVIPPQSFIYV